MARGPAEVLVAVGVEFCRVCQSLLNGVRSATGKRGAKPLSLSKEIPGMQHRGCIVLSRVRSARFEGGGLGIMYRSISGGPGQGSGLVNWLAADISCALEDIRL